MTRPAYSQGMLKLSHSGLKSIAALEPEKQRRLLASVAKWVFVLALAPVVFGAIPAVISNHPVIWSKFAQLVFWLGAFGAFLRLGSMFTGLSLVFTDESVTALGPKMHATYSRGEVKSVQIRNLALLGATDVVVVVQGYIEDHDFALTTRSDFESVRRQLEDLNYPVVVVSDDSGIQKLR